MPDPPWNDEQLNGFHQAVQSLKLYRRAELQDESTGESMIGYLYVDPLPNDHVLNTIRKPNTTFLVGRKGTGKSTVFQRAQHELRDNRQCVTAYVDIKTVYESATADRGTFDAVAEATDAMSRETLEKLMLHQAFISAAISEIRKELSDRVKSSIWSRIKEHVTGTVDMLFEGLDELLEDAKKPAFRSVLGSRRVQLERSEEEEDRSTVKVGGSVAVGPKPELRIDAGAEEQVEHSISEKAAYVDLLIRTFNVKELIRQLQQLLQTVGVKHLYVFVDDFSELPAEAMEIVVDTLLAPLNNWSNELVKFKIAAYPGRIYFGEIDKTKIDEIYLDTFYLYGGSDVSTMEEKAIDFTRRLVETRLKHFCDGAAPSLFLDTGQPEFWRTLFHATTANPRILGYLLFYVYERELIYGNRVGIRAIQEAARKYYEEKLEPYFGMNRFLHQTFEERSSVLGMRELLESIVKRARELRTHDSAVIKKIPGRPPTSHFHVIVELDSLLSTLELNFFLTKYYEMADRDARKVSVFALNYGLCQKNTIAFGRPTGEREFRLYFVERFFDYTPILQNYIASNQEIVCDNCNEKIGIEQLDAIKVFGMMCPKCKRGTCQVINLTKKYQDVIEAIDSELLLPGTELGILQTIHAEGRPLFAADIAGELDCSYQLVGRRAKNLDERGLVKRELVNDPPYYNRRQFELTEAAVDTYFEEKAVDQLDVE